MNKATPEEWAELNLAMERRAHAKTSAEAAEPAQSLDGLSRELHQTQKQLAEVAIERNRLRGQLLVERGRRVSALAILAEMGPVAWLLMWRMVARLEAVLTVEVEREAANGEQ